MAKRAELKVKITGDKSNLDSTLRGAKAGLKSFGSAAVAGMKVVAVTAAAAGVALAYGVKKAYDLGGEMVDLGAKTGIAADQLLILQQAGKDAGLDDVTSAVNKLQKALVDSVKNGAGPAAEALATLSLSAEDLIKKSPVDQLEAIGDALAKIQSPEIRTSVTRDLFGKSGPQMIGLLTDKNGLREAARSIGDQARILKDNAQAFDAVSDRLNRAGLKLQGFMVGVAKGVLPQMDAITKRFDKLDFSSQGVKFGNAISGAVDQLNKFFGHPELTLQKFAMQLSVKIREALNASVPFMFPVVSGMGTKDPFGAGKAQAGVNALEAAESGVDAFTMPEVEVKAKEPFTPRNKTLTTGALSTTLGAPGFKSAFAEKFGPADPRGAMFSGIGKTGALTRPAFGQTPLLSLRERRASQNRQVAEGSSPDIRATTAGAYGVVRAGDRKRAENVAKQKLRDEETLKGTNAHLKAIEDATKTTAEAVSE